MEKENKHIEHLECPRCSAPLTLTSGGSMPDHCYLCEARLEPLLNDEAQLIQKARQQVAADGKFTSPNPHSHPIGSLFMNRYRIIGLKGTGGFARVYEARDTNLNDRPVAVKLVSADLMLKEPKVGNRFQNEIAAMASLRHPNIVTLFDAGATSDGGGYMIMELMEGGTLKDLIGNQGPVAWQEALNYASDLCNALAQIHSQGLVHRDIKPENVLFMRQDWNLAKLADLGIVHMEPSLSAVHTETGSQPGTLMWMAPEQIQGLEPSERTDIYSFGATLYFMLTGRPYFPSSALVSLPRIIDAVANTPHIPINDVVSGLPVELVDLINQSLCKDPKTRLRSANEMGDSLLKIKPKPHGHPSGLESVHEQIRKQVPGLIKKLEQNTGGVGALRQECNEMIQHVGNIPRQQIIKLFSEAGRRVGSGHEVTGEERGLLALIQMYSELGDNQTAYELGVESLKCIPNSFILYHFTASTARMASARRAATQKRELLQEAVMYERRAQSLPHSTRHSHYSVSLSVLAQACHDLALLFRLEGDQQKFRSLLKESIDTFERSFQKERGALRLALYATALRDAGEPEKALQAAREACEREWFMREGQNLVLELSTIAPEVEMSFLEEHARRWSLVVGEWPNSSERHHSLRAYVEFLRKHSLWPELLSRSEEMQTRGADSRLKSKITHRDRKQIEGTSGSSQIHTTIDIWDDDQGQVFAGIPDIKVFSKGASIDEATRYLTDFVVFLDKHSKRSRWQHPPEVERFRRWCKTHLVHY